MKNSKIQSINILNEIKYTSVNNQIIRNDIKLNVYERSVLLYMLSHSIKFNFSIEKMAKKLEISERQAYRALKALKEKGFLTKQGNRKNGFVYSLTQTPNGSPKLLNDQKEILQDYDILKTKFKDLNEFEGYLKTMYAKLRHDKQTEEEKRENENFFEDLKEAKRISKEIYYKDNE